MKANIYPELRYILGAPRWLYSGTKKIATSLNKRSRKSAVIPDSYRVCNTTTIDSDLELNVIEGELPKDIDGNMYICQCLGSPEAFMMGDTNIVKLGLSKGKATLKNRMMWSPAAIARAALSNTRHRFDHRGLMFMSPGMGIFSYTEGMYLLSDGRIAVTSDVDRPWVVDRENLRIQTPLGRREEWLPMMTGNAAKVMGELFAGYSNSHVIYTDTNTEELFLVNYQYKQADGNHACNLMRWDGGKDFQSWNVVDESGETVQIMQSIHELIFTRDYIILADTAFVTGPELIVPWINAPLPNKKTVVYIVDRRTLTDDVKSTTAKRIEIDEACIHLIADYENPNDILNIYMLHTPATNTAEIIRSYDRDLKGRLFPQNTVGYGTLPVLDISSIGKHVVDMHACKVVSSDYIRDKKYCWGPYMYTYMGRQTRAFDEQDLYIMFKGFRANMMPQRIYDAYKDVEDRKISLEEMFVQKGVESNNSIARIDKKTFEIADVYEMPDKVLLYTISCIETNEKDHPGYVLAAVVRDTQESQLTTGHEYWIFSADRLSDGPICKLGHKELDNTILFHTLYLTASQEKELDKKNIGYKISLEEDYPKQELDVFDPKVKSVFEKLIYPYFHSDETEERLKAERVLRDMFTRRVSTQEGSEYLIGEEVVTDAVKFAQRMFDEANRMFSTTGWKRESLANGVLVESKPVDGPFKTSGIYVTRARGVVGVDADSFFEYITSPKGYAVIDPVSDPTDHKKTPLEVYEWKEGARLEAAVAGVNIPMMQPADFVVLNAIDPQVRMFASKSIIHSAMPGASRYSVAEKPTNGHERALNTFVIKVEPFGKNRSRVLCINYADMAGKTSAAMNNFINTKVFFKSLYKRMRAVRLED